MKSLKSFRLTPELVNGFYT